MYHTCQTTFVNGINPFLGVSLYHAKPRVSQREAAPTLANHPKAGSKTHEVYTLLSAESMTFDELALKLRITNKRALRFISDLVQRRLLDRFESRSTLTENMCYRYIAIASRHGDDAPATPPPVLKSYLPILQHIASHPGISQKQMVIDLQIAKSFVQYVVGRLMKDGRICLVEKSTTGREPRKFYRIKEYLQ